MLMRILVRIYGIKLYMLFFVILFMIVSSLVGGYFTYFVLYNFLPNSDFLHFVITLLIAGIVYAILLNLYIKIRGKH